MFLLKYLRCGRLKKYPNIALNIRNLETSSTHAEGSSKKEQNKYITSALTNDKFGQPTAATHPHLINKNELVPGFTRQEFQERRQRLMAVIQRHVRDNRQLETFSNRNHLVIIPSATKKFMSDKIPYVFRQNSDFYYLSGCLEPDTVLMVFIDTTGNVISTLFMRPKDEHAELWDGARTGVDASIEMFGVDKAYSNHKFEEILSLIITRDKPVVWFDSKNSEINSVRQTVQKVVGQILDINNPCTYVHAMRLYKSASEQALMQRTCDIASNAINEVIRESRPGQSEHHLFAMVDYKCRMNNASFLAYPPVVASGDNTTTIHYINNSQLIKSGDLVIMDAGCEYGGYTSDITRTWPISGEFSEPQKILYDIVSLLQAELLGNYILKEGGDTLDNLFDTMCLKLGKYLQEAGLVPKDVSTDTEYIRAGFKFCPHHVSHYLGMDVHDTPSMPRTLRLLPSMVFTVEPGIYIGHDRTDVPPEFRGLGVRIEDDILINAKNEIVVLTEKCLKERSALENAFTEKAIQKQ